MKIQLGSVVLIKGDEKNKEKGSIRILEELLKREKDNVIHGVKLQTPKSQIKRPYQYLYPLEQHCDREKPTSKSKSTSPKKQVSPAKQYKPRITATTIPKM